MWDYRFLFQSQESDDEIRGKGNSLNYKFRMHDPRIGRFFAVDPLAAKYPWNSSYAFSENRVVDGVELEGLEYIFYKVMSYNDHGQTCIELTGKIDYGRPDVNLFHKITGRQPSVTPVHVVEAPDGMHYLFATKEEAYTSTMEDYHKGVWTLEGIGAIYTLTEVFGVISSNTIKANPSSTGNNNPPKQIGNDAIETISNAAGKAMDASEEVINQSERNNEPDKIDTEEKK